MRILGNLLASIGCGVLAFNAFNNVHLACLIFVVMFILTTALLEILKALENIK